MMTIHSELRTWTVDYELLEDGTPTYIKTGFKTKAEAQAWASKNTTDGKVGYMDPVTFD